MQHRVWGWLRRYAPAELAATAGALLGAAAAGRLAGPAAAAVTGAIGEAVAFYGFVVVRELRVERAAARGRGVRRVLADLLVEFGPAEALDTLAVRPLAMYAGPVLAGDLVVGIVAGKVAADVVFYALAAAGHQLRHRPAALPDPFALPDPLGPAALDARTHRTPSSSSTWTGSSTPTGPCAPPCRWTRSTTP